MNAELPQERVADDRSVATAAKWNANGPCMVKLAVIAAFAASGLANRAVAAPATVTLEEALAQSAAGTTIPLSSYSVDFGKGNGLYKGVIVGGNPFSGIPTPVTIDVVVIPLTIQIITPDNHLVVFDPTIPTACGGGVSAVDRLKHSPLVVSKDHIVNGVDVGDVQYINAFMRAEFWNASEFSKFLDDHLHWTFVEQAPIPLPPFTPEVGIVEGDVSTPGCWARGIVTQSVLVGLIQDWIPLLQYQGVISPTKLALFLMRDVVTSVHAPPVSEKAGGAHSAIGNPVQTYAWVPYLTNNFDALAGKQDIHSISHEIGEWMMDPLIGLKGNKTPKWSAPGAKKCSSVLEVGDPIEKWSVAVETDGYTYHPQELAFFSWFYNGENVPSFGAGGEFSSNGHFAGPARPCPPGGTYR